MAATDQQLTGNVKASKPCFWSCPMTADRYSGKDRYCSVIRAIYTNRNSKYKIKNHFKNSWIRIAIWIVTKTWSILPKISSKSVYNFSRYFANRHTHGTHSDRFGAQVTKICWTHKLASGQVHWFWNLRIVLCDGDLVTTASTWCEYNDALAPCDF